MEDLLALDRQETGEDTFGEASTENDDLGPSVSRRTTGSGSAYERRILHPWWVSKIGECGGDDGGEERHLVGGEHAAKSHRCTCIHPVLRSDLRGHPAVSHPPTSRCRGHSLGTS